MDEASLDKLHRAAEELNKANTALQTTFNTWSECNTNLHLAAVALNDARKRNENAYRLLTTTLNEFAGGQWP